MRDILVDTDVLIDFFRDYPPAVEYLKVNRSRIRLSPIVIAEIFSGVLSSEEESIRGFVSVFPVEAVSGEIALRGGYLKRKYGPSHGISLADALIAATVLERDYELATLNTKHFPMLPRLQPAYTK